MEIVNFIFVTKNDKADPSYCEEFAKQYNVQQVFKEVYNTEENSKTYGEFKVSATSAEVSLDFMEMLFEAGQAVGFIAVSKMNLPELSPAHLKVLAKDRIIFKNHEGEDVTKQVEQDKNSMLYEGLIDSLYIDNNSLVATIDDSQDWANEADDDLTIETSGYTC